ncbi:hypothetical protein [Paraburkholderia sp.]|uniref:hypothetical protein n=1 Tax=Paraburkholderia sp. TaxID=1926495 RepID=UPI003D6E5975
MSKTNPLVRFQRFLTVYENCRTATLGRALQTPSFATRTLEIICSAPGITRRDLTSILDEPSGQVMGALRDLQRLRFIEIYDEQQGCVPEVIIPIKGRIYGIDSYQQLVARMAEEAGIAWQLDILLSRYQKVLVEALVELHGGEQSVDHQAQHRVLVGL